MKIPNDSIVVTDYEKHLFENYYWNDDEFFYYNGIDYRTLHINETISGYKFVFMRDINGENVRVKIAMFKKIYGLM